MVTLTIDSREVTVAPGTTILEAARQLGITIPTLCWLQKVSPTGACRVCAVEVAGVERTMTACNTPVKEGIQVTTQSERLSAIRTKIMELMLVNHPLDCPVCDAGGECDLQNACYGLSVDKQEYAAVLERRPIRYDWKLLESDPNRCILCEKCVKVDHEVVGCDAIAVVDRGEATIIDTVDGKPLNCEFCGNCIAACPTGTLISKPFKFRGRPWTFKVTPSVCGFCGSGCQIDYHSRNGRVERVTSEDDTFNRGNLCINGRFGYTALSAPERLTVPLLAGAASDWNSAMQKVADGLKGIIASHGGEAVAGIASPRLSNEELYLFQKFLRGAVGSNHIDSELRYGYAPAVESLQQRFGCAGASAGMERVDQAGAVLVLGCDLNAESTNLEYRAIQAALKNDAKLVLANLRSVKLRKFSNSFLQYRSGSETLLVNALTKLLLEAGAGAGLDNLAELQASLAGLSLVEAAAATGLSEAALREAAQLLVGKPGLAIIFGADLLRAPDAAAAVTALGNLALVSGVLTGSQGGLYPVDEKNNSLGLLDMGVAPDRLPGWVSLAAGAERFGAAWGKAVPVTPGRDLPGIIAGIESGAIRALYVLGTDLLALPESARIKAALQKLELLVVQGTFPNGTSALAHVFLPAAMAAEKSGSFTALDGRVQALNKAVDAPGEAREDWDIIVELCNRLGWEQRQVGIAGLQAEIAALAGGYGTPARPSFQPAAAARLQPVSAAALPTADSTLLVGPELYHSGSTTTWSANNLTVAPAGYLAVASADAARLGISDGTAVKVTAGSASITAPARVSDKLPAGLVFAPYHYRELNAAALLSGSANRVAVTLAKA